MSRITRRTFAKMATASLAGLASPPVIGKVAARVVVIGGGPGGATAARYLKKLSPELDVTLIEPKRHYTTCFFSNWYLGGLRDLASITHDYTVLKDRHGVKMVHDLATGIDPAAKRITLSAHPPLGYDRLIVAPGININFESIPGYSPKAAQSMPHAFHAGPQTLRLRKQLAGMKDGGTVLICPPANPYRCPPAPYERASMIAWYLKQHKPKSKIIIIDAKDKFSKQALFEEGWARHYPDMIEWLPAELTGGILSVDARSMSVETDGETFEADVANIIPAQSAGEIARRAGLADASGWCPVDPLTMASTRQADIHVIGDAANASHMPKSAFGANQHAKVAVMAIRAALTGSRRFPVRFSNTCWSLLAPDDAVKTGGRYRLENGQLIAHDSFLSDPEENARIRKQTATEASAWYAGFVRDVFGEPG